jgi:HSP20 family protein
MKALTHWDPFRALRKRDETFEDLVREMFGGGEAETAMPPVEVSESDGDVLVKMVVPGVEKDQLDISVHDDTLTVRGELRKESEEKKKNFYRQEIRYGAFQRAVPLPVEVEDEGANAALKNGMLTVTLHKSKQPKARAIKVS